MNWTSWPALPVMLIVSGSLSIAPVAAHPEFDGVYVSRGTNPDGSEYRGAVHILRQGERFLVTWLTPRVDGKAIRLELSSMGVGIVIGESLSVSYMAGAGIGIVVYQIGKDGELAGRWTTAGEDGAVHSETLTKVPELRPAEPAAADPPAEEPQPPPATAVPRRRAPRPPAGTTSL